MNQPLLYGLSFLILFFAELCGNFHAISVVSGRKQAAAFSGALSSALWCAKIVVIVNQPLTILTALQVPILEVSAHGQYNLRNELIVTTYFMRIV